MAIGLIISLITTAAKLAQAGISANNKAGNNAVQQAQQMQEKANQGMSQYTNKYFKEDLLNYMNFLKQNMTQ